MCDGEPVLLVALEKPVSCEFGKPAAAASSQAQVCHSPVASPGLPAGPDRFGNSEVLLSFSHRLSAPLEPQAQLAVLALQVVIGFFELRHDNLHFAA